MYERTVTAKNLLIENGVYERFGKIGSNSGRREAVIKNLKMVKSGSEKSSRKFGRFCPWPESLFVGIAKHVLQTNESQIIIKNIPPNFHEVANTVLKELPEDVEALLESYYRKSGKTDEEETNDSCKNFKRSKQRIREEMYAATCFISAYNSKSDVQLSTAFMVISQEIFKKSLAKSGGKISEKAQRI